MAELVVVFCIRTSEPALARRLLATSTLVPGTRRTLDESVTIVFRRERHPALRNMPMVYEFAAHLGGPDAARILAERLVSDLRGGSAILDIGRDEIPLVTPAIERAFSARMEQAGRR